MIKFNIEHLSETEDKLRQIAKLPHDQEKLESVVAYLIDANKYIHSYLKTLNDIADNLAQVAKFQSVANDNFNKLHQITESNEKMIDIYGQHLEIIDKTHDTTQKLIDLQDERLDLIESRLDLIDP